MLTITTGLCGYIVSRREASGYWREVSASVENNEKIPGTRVFVQLVPGIVYSVYPFVIV